MPQINIMTGYWIAMGIIALGATVLWVWAMLSIREEKKQKQRDKQQHE